MGATCSCLRVASDSIESGNVSASTGCSKQGSASAGGGKAAAPRHWCHHLPAEAAAAMEAARNELDRSQKLGSIKERYQLGHIVGHGAFARVYEARHLASGRAVAIKVIPKSPAAEAEMQRRAVVREVAIMRRLEGHPAVPLLFEAAEGRTRYYLVMELCRGGELFDQIIARGHFSESSAAALARQLLSFVAWAHGRGVVHRDIKPENCLLDRRGPGAALKVIDYGSSAFVVPGRAMTTKLGTPYYVSPEVLERNYGPPADVWSCGVVLYILLCGRPPFGGRDNERVLARVARGSYSFTAREWDLVSESAKHVVTLCLTREPSERPTAEELLQDPWLRGGRPAAAAAAAATAAVSFTAKRRPSSSAASAAAAAAATSPGGAAVMQEGWEKAKEEEGQEVVAAAACRSTSSTSSSSSGGEGREQRRGQQQGAAADELGTHIVSRLRAFAGMSRMKRLALVCLARTLTERDVARLRDIFEAMDVDGDGAIAVDDLQTALERVGASPGAEELRQLLAASDPDGRGRIDYEAFLGAMLDSNRVATSKKAVRRSFQALDRDGDGLITASDLAQLLSEAASHNSAPQIGDTRCRSPPPPPPAGAAAPAAAPRAAAAGRPPRAPPPRRRAKSLDLAAKSYDQAASLMTEVGAAGRRGASTFEVFRDRVWGSGAAAAAP